MDIGQKAIAMTNVCHKGFYLTTAGEYLDPVQLPLASNSPNS